MIWASDYLPVPKVVPTGWDVEVDWMVTQALRGCGATDPALTRDRESLVRILAKGLRTFHEAPVGRCPFDFRFTKTPDHARLRLVPVFSTPRALLTGGFFEFRDRCGHFAWHEERQPVDDRFQMPVDCCGEVFFQDRQEGDAEHESGEGHESRSGTGPFS